LTIVYLISAASNLQEQGGNVLANDTVNGQVATAANTNVTPAADGPLSIDVDGNVTVAQTHQTRNTYNIMRSVRQVLPQQIITAAIVTMVISNPIVASDTASRTGSIVGKHLIRLTDK
jgi:hypothetical protein